VVTLAGDEALKPGGPGPVLPLPADGRRQLIVKRALGAVAADGVDELFVPVDMSAYSAAWPHAS
jgi:hypothetical protein